MAVFEGVIYHAVVVDASHPCRPMLEVDAVLRPGDADRGPLLLSLNEWAAMAGGRAAIESCLGDLAERGRIVDHLGVPHLSFPFWEPVDVSGPSPAEGSD